MKKMILLFVSTLFFVAPVFAQGAIGFSNVLHADGTVSLNAKIFNTTGSSVDVTFHCHGTITNGSPGFPFPYAFYFQFGTVGFNYNDNYIHPSGSFTATEQETITIPPGETIFNMLVVNDPGGYVVMACMMDYVPGVTMTNSSVYFSRNQD